LGQLASEVRQRPFQKLLVDHVGKFPRSRTFNTMLLVCVDAFYEFVWIVPVREATTKAIIKAFTTSPYYPKQSHAKRVNHTFKAALIAKYAGGIR
jgi:hypothetical protein